VFARRREINIMKYIGATDWFTDGPLLLRSYNRAGWSLYKLCNHIFGVQNRRKQYSERHGNA